MKRVTLVLTVLLCLVVVAMAATDFSGTWAMNADKSDQMGGGGRAGGGGGGRGGGGGEIVIAMTGTEMTITRSMGGNSMETKYVLDGAEHTNSSQRGELKYKAVWEGNTLTVSGTQTSQRGESPMKEQYSLSADGKELTVATTRMGQNGETVRKVVYDKK